MHVCLLTILTLTLHGDGGAALRCEYTRPEMGVPVRIVLYADSQDQADRAAEAAYARFEELNAVMSDYDPESELRRLCASRRAAEGVRVSDDLWTVLARARQISEATDGAFDVTVGPLVALWRQSRHLMRLPREHRMVEAMASVGYRRMVLNEDGRTVRLAAPNMRIDLGGIAKGYAIGEALKAIRAEGVASALVDAGGDIGCTDAPPGETGWRIAIAGLGEMSDEECLVLANASVATSGDRWQFVEIDGARYSHIVDPRTGMAITGRRSVTVVGHDPMTVDAWASALNVMESDEGVAALDAAEDLAARCTYESEDRIHTVESRGWPELQDAGILQPLVPAN